MTVSHGSPLAVEAEVSETYDVGKGQGYMVTKSITVEGTPGEAVILNGFLKSIKGAGDLPIYAKVTRTWTGRQWPWTKIISKFDVEYQAVHMAEDSVLATIAGVILYALPYLASILLVLLAWRVVNYFILKGEDVGQWMDKYGSQAAAGMGAGVIILLALALSRGDKK